MADLKYPSSSDKYSLTPTPDLDSPTGVYIPADIDDAIAELEKMLHPALIEEIKVCSPEELIGKYHFGLLMWMRGNWGLWHGSRLAGFLKSQGISHSDSMSSAVLTAFWQYLNQV